MKVKQKPILDRYPAVPSRLTSAPQDATPAVLPGSQVFLIPGAYYIAHVLEELPGFVEWSSRHFSPITSGTFATFEILSLLLVFFASHKSLIKQRHGAWVVLAVAAQFQFALNALFHLTTAIVFTEYSPGMVTGVAVGIPVTIYFMKRVWGEQRVTRREMTIALALGMAIAGAAVGLLFV